MKDLKLSDQAKIYLSLLDDEETLYHRVFKDVSFLGDEDDVSEKIGISAITAKVAVIDAVERIKSLEKRSSTLENEIEREFCLYRAKFLRASFSSVHPVMRYEKGYEEYFKNSKVLFKEVLHFEKDQIAKKNELIEQDTIKLQNPETFKEASDRLLLNHPYNIPSDFWIEYAKQKESEGVKVRVPNEAAILYCLSFIDEDACYYERIIEIRGVDDEYGMWAAKKLENLKEKERKKSSGCFIATAVYGSPYAYEVILLKEFRDNWLLNFRLGKMFVTFYYWISPPIACKIAKSNSLKSITKSFLVRPMINIAKYLKIKED
jgi:uncharacterized protein (UPF0248 family)